MKRIFYKRVFIKFVLLLGFWLLLSGHYDFFHISMGVFSSILVIGLNYRLKKHFFFKENIRKNPETGHSTRSCEIRILRLLYYIPWLIWQITVASIQVAYVVLHPKLPINPVMLRFRTTLPNTTANVILGNSITLTPGTITVELQKDEFLVHALMEASFTGISDGSLPGQVARLYEKEPGQVVKDLRVTKSVRVYS